MTIHTAVNPILRLSLPGRCLAPPAGPGQGTPPWLSIRVPVMCFSARTCGRNRANVRKAKHVITRTCRPWMGTSPWGWGWSTPPFTCQYSWHPNPQDFKKTTIGKERCRTTYIFIHSRTSWPSDLTTQNVVVPRCVWKVNECVGWPPSHFCCTWRCVTVSLCSWVC